MSEDRLVTIFLSNGKKITGRLSKDFMIVNGFDGMQAALIESFIVSGKEIINSNHISFIRAALSEEIDYYNTHGLGRRKSVE